VVERSTTALFVRTRHLPPSTGGQERAAIDLDGDLLARAQLDIRSSWTRTFTASWLSPAA
jgi:hypothetical protein